MWLPAQREKTDAPFPRLVANRLETILRAESLPISRRVRFLNALHVTHAVELKFTIDIGGGVDSTKRAASRKEIKL